MPLAFKHVSIELKDLSLPVSLGVTENERRLDRCIRVSLRFTFSTPPQALDSDRLEDTLCYDRVARLLMSSLDGLAFCLIEHVGAFLAQQLEDAFDLQEKGITTELVLKKTHPLLDREGDAYLTLSW